MLGLLFRTPRFEVMLNRRMPNGMYGGVRGERKSPLLDLCASIDWVKNKADWYDPTIAKDDEFFRKQEHEKDKEKKRN